MIAASTADTVTFSAVGFVIIVAIVVVWRILVYDRSIRRIRLGIFYEREREGDEPTDRSHTNEEEDP